MLKLGVCIGADENKVKVLKDLGYDYFEVHTGELCALSQNDYDLFSESVKKIGLPCECANCFIPSNLKIVGDNIDYPALEDYVQIAFSRLNELGVSVVVFGSSGARKPPEGFATEKAFEQVVLFLSKIIAPLAKNYGLLIAIEPLNKKECSWINNLSFSKRIAEAVDEDCIKLLADLYHMEEEGDQVDGLAQYKGKIVHAHVARPGIRTCPLPNDKYDYLPFLKELETIGCERCSIEARFNNFEAEAETALLFLSIH